LFSKSAIFHQTILFFQTNRTNVVMNYTDVEVKVREATNDEAWGPHGTLMQEIAQYTLTYEHYTEVMSMLWKRMFQEKENWRATYKVSLYFLIYFVILP
jgi:hypothetical protein